MRTLLLSLATGALMLGGGFAAQAMPAGAVAADASPQVILVSGGCGPAFHRGPFGGCRPNGGFYGRPFGYGRGYGYGRRFEGYHRGYYRPF